MDNHSPIPLYHQLKVFIEEQIASGAWQPGERVPSESDLGTQFRISRTTVRQALGDLVNQGLLSRSQGRGTFVAQPRIQQPLSRLTSFTQDMVSRRKRPSSRILAFERLPAPAPVAAALGLPVGQPVIILKRIRLADDVPMSVETAHLAFADCEQLLALDLSQLSLYAFLRENMNVHPSHASQQIEATSCPLDQARLLGIHKDSPVLHIHRTTFDQHEHPFEVVESYYRGDRYVFYVELQA